MRNPLLTAILICLCSQLYRQQKFTYIFSGDSVKVTNCDSSELIIENHTQGVPGFLCNTGNGRTIFKRAAQKLNDSMYLIGTDTGDLLCDKQSNNNVVYLSGLTGTETFDWMVFP